MSREDLKTAVGSFSEGADFDQAWAEAAVAEPEGWGRRAVLPALAAAAVLAFLGWSTFAPVEDETAGMGLEAADAESVEGVHLGVGNSAFYETDREVISIAVVDPEVVVVQSLGVEGAFQIQGAKAGRTDMVVDFAEGEPEVLTYWVDAAFDETLADSILPVGDGMYAVLDLDFVPRAIALVNPEIAEVQSLGTAHQFAVRGLSPGWTDLVLMSEAGVEEVIAVEVSGTPIPVANTLTMAVGQAIPWDIPRPISVMISDPDVLEVSSTRDSLMMSAHAVGMTDVMATYADEVVHYRVIVE